MKIVKSYSLESETVEVVKAVSSVLRSSDSVALDILIRLGYNAMKQYDGNVINLLGGSNNGSETEA